MSLGIALSFIAVAAIVTAMLITASCAIDARILRLQQPPSAGTAIYQHHLRIERWSRAILAVSAVLMAFQIIGLLGAFSGRTIPDTAYQVWKTLSVASLIPLLFSVIIRMEYRQMTSRS